MRYILFSIFAVFLLSNFTSNEDFISFNSALQQAKKQDKHVLLIFSGSDWCKTCIMLKRNVLDSEEFKNYSNEKLVVVHLDFPYKKANQLPAEQKLHNDKLAEKYNSDGSISKASFTR